MKIKTCDLTGIALDWAVTVAKGIETYGPEDFREQRKYTVKNGEYVYRWSTSREQGWSVIEEADIDVMREREVYVTDRGTEVVQAIGWRAHIGPSRVGQAPRFAQLGPTQLIAGLRCFISYTLGDEVEIADMLLA